MSRDLMHSAEIKDLVRDAYRHVPPTTAAVAHNLYSNEQLALVPQSAIDRALGVANHLRHATIRSGTPRSTSGAEAASTPSWPRTAPARPVG
jgi:arsenite methyltransferase